MRHESVPDAKGIPLPYEFLRVPRGNHPWDKAPAAHVEQLPARTVYSFMDRGARSGPGL